METSSVVRANLRTLQHRLRPERSAQPGCNNDNSNDENFVERLANLTMKP